MIIIGKDGTQILNLDHVADMYINDMAGIKANMSNGKGCQIAKYDNPDVGKLALRKLAEAAQRNAGVFAFPKDEDLQRELVSERYRHIDGKKTKGHGGS